MNEGAAENHESILVIGYGNTLRRDDALGRNIAETIAGWNLPHVRVLSLHQLTPELAQDMAACDKVFFVDACADGIGKTVDVICIDASESPASFEHSSNPRALLAFTRAIFGVCPMAWCITVPGTDFELGEGLTEHAERGMAIALCTIARLLDAEQSILPRERIVGQFPSPFIGVRPDVAKFDPEMPVSHSLPQLLTNWPVGLLVAVVSVLLILWAVWHSKSDSAEMTEIVGSMQDIENPTDAEDLLEVA